MLKGFVSGEEKDIVRIPMKGKNLWDNPNTISKGQSHVYYEAVLGTPLPEGVYTFSAKVIAEAGVTACMVSFRKGTTGPIVASNIDVSSERTSITVTLTEPCYAVYLYGSTSYVTSASVTYQDIMLNPGDTALPYEPYGYQEGWEVRDNQNRLIWGREDELQTTTGTLPFKGYDLPIKVKSLLGNSVQNGTPSPVNVVIPEFCGVRTENLIDESKVTLDTYLSEADGKTGSSTVSDTTDYIEINASSLVISGVRTIDILNSNTRGVCFYDSDKKYIRGNAYSPDVMSRPAIISNIPTDAKYIRFAFDKAFENGIMLNAGSTALPFEPYGYKITFENHGENLCPTPTWTNSQSTDTRIHFQIRVLAYMGSTIVTASPYVNTSNPGIYTTSITLSEAADKLVIKHNGSSRDLIIANITINGTAGESYTVSMYVETNDPTTLGGIKVRDIMLNLGSTTKPYSPYLNETIPIYLGETPTIRRIKKLVLTGTEENITAPHIDVGLFNIPVTDYLKIANVVTNICSHYRAEINVNGWSDVTDLTCRFYGNAGSPSKLLYIRDSSFSTVTDFKSYLTAQYANGTPVTVWYVLSEPETGIINEQLCKIGDYADELTTIKVQGLSAPLYGIGDYKDTLNLSTGVVTRKIKKYVLDGTESWRLARSGGLFVCSNVIRDYYRVTGVEICLISHYIAQPNFNSNTQVIDKHAGFYSNPTNTYYDFYIFDSDYEDVSDFKSYLATQYQNGTPVTIWYVLETPTTETVTVPTGMTGEIEGYLTQISTPTPTNRSVPKWNGKEETGGTYAVTVYNLPEIETTTGKNTLTVDTTLAPYNVIVDGHIKYTYWGKIREDVRSGLAQTKFPVGTILYDNNDETTGRAFQVVGYDKHFDPSLTARGYTHSMTLCQLKLSGPWQFDATEAFLYTTVEMQPGTYKFKIPNYDTTYGGNKTYYFTSTASVPVDSQITLSWAYQQLPKTVTAYAGPNPQTNTTAITGFNALQLSEWVEGESPEAIDLGTIKLANNDPDSAYGKLNHIHRARYGSNNYYQSGLRQLLNTDLASNNWWHPTTIFDRPYANRTTNGYLRSLNEDFINVLATPEITHIANNIFEYPSLDGRTFTLNTEYKINTDKVFLLSHTEVGLSASPNIGTVLDYYSTHNTNNDRIKYRIDNGNAYYWWFRTPYPTYASIFRFCSASGALNYSGANGSYGVAPAHIIQ